MSIMHEETFGPVLPVVAFDTLEEAISMANDSDYGLTSSIYTQNLNVAMKAIKGLKFGETYINRENFEAMQGFHAGWRKSGIGGADGKHGLHEYLQTRGLFTVLMSGRGGGFSSACVRQSLANFSRVRMSCVTKPYSLSYQATVFTSCKSPTAVISVCVASNTDPKWLPMISEETISSSV